MASNVFSAFCGPGPERLHRRTNTHLSASASWPEAFSGEAKEPSWLKGIALRKTKSDVGEAAVCRKRWVG